MRILLAEDEDDAVVLMRRFLGALVSKIDVTKALDETIAAAGQGEYDIIILDLRLIRNSTIDDVINAIHTLKQLSGAPLIVVSGQPDPTLESRCLRAGADAFMHKADALRTDRMEDGVAVNSALLMALHAAVLHHPKQRSHTFIEHVAALERLVRHS